MCHEIKHLFSTGISLLSAVSLLSDILISETVSVVHIVIFDILGIALSMSLYSRIIKSLSELDR